MTADNSNKPVLLITGSSGLLGTALAKAFVKDFRVIGLDIKQPDEPVEGSEHIDCDLTDDEKVRATLETVREKYGDGIASVIHLAAYYDFSGGESEMYRELTVEGTRRLIRGLKEFDVEQFVFSSSLLVMKPTDQQEGRDRLTEDAPTRAEWRYPASKLEAEKVLEEEHGDIPCVVMRIAGVYHDQCGSLPISDHIRRIYEKELESYLFPGDKEHGQPYIHLDDLVDCLRQAVAQRGELNDWELFLIAEPDTMSFDELQDTLGELIHGKEWPALRVPKPVAKAGAWVKDRLPWEDPFIKPWMVDLADDHYPVEIARAQERLGWTPQHRLRSALKTMIELLQRDPKGFYEANGLNGPDRKEK